MVLDQEKRRINQQQKQQLLCIIHYRKKKNCELIYIGLAKTFNSINYDELLNKKKNIGQIISILQLFTSNFSGRK